MQSTSTAGRRHRGVLVLLVLTLCHALGVVVLVTPSAAEERQQYHRYDIRCDDGNQCTCGVWGVMCNISGNSSFGADGVCYSGSEDNCFCFPIEW